MNPIIEDICKKHRITPEEFFGSHPYFAPARKEAILALRDTKLNARQIAQEVGCHLQTVYYWLRPARRLVMLKKNRQTFQINRLNGPKQSKKQRDEILAAYLRDPAEGTAMAVRRGLAPLYAYKLARAMGVIPLTRHRSGNPNNALVTDHQAGS